MKNFQDKKNFNGKPLSGLRVLLADDSADNRTLIRYYLTSMGAVCASVNDGLQAIDRALAEHYDLVLMDLRMPRMDGHQTTVELRKRGCQLPVIGLTAHLSCDDRYHGAEEGFSDFIERPVSRGELMTSILRHVKRA